MEWSIIYASPTFRFLVFLRSGVSLAGSDLTIDDTTAAPTSGPSGIGATTVSVFGTVSSIGKGESSGALNGEAHAGTDVFGTGVSRRGDIAISVFAGAIGTDDSGIADEDKCGSGVSTTLAAPIPDESLGGIEATTEETLLESWGNGSGVFACDRGIGVAGAVTPFTKTGFGLKLRVTDLQLPENHRLSGGIRRLPVPCVVEDALRSRMSMNASHRMKRFPCELVSSWYISSPRYNCFCISIMLAAASCMRCSRSSAVNTALASPSLGCGCRGNSSRLLEDALLISRSGAVSCSFHLLRRNRGNVRPEGRNAVLSRMRFVMVNESVSIFRWIPKRYEIVILMDWGMRNAARHTSTMYRHWERPPHILPKQGSSSILKY